MQPSSSSISQSKSGFSSLSKAANNDLYFFKAPNLGKRPAVEAVRNSLDFPKQIDFRRRRRTEQLKSGHPAPWPYEAVLPVIEATPQVAASYVAIIDTTI